MSSGRRIAAALLLGACGGDGGGAMVTQPGDVSSAPPKYQAAQPLTVQPAQWNVNKTDVGDIVALTELQDDDVVYSDKGASVFSGGALAAQDASVTAWRGAATIPGADGTGDWAVGIDGTGQMEHLRARSLLEPISDRYGLATDAVHALAFLGYGKVGFALDAQVAISDGQHVTRFDDAKLDPIAGGGGKLAGVAPDGSVHVIDPAAMTRTVYTLTDAVGVAYGIDGALYVAAKHVLYVEQSMQLVPLYADPGATFHGIAASGATVWVGVDGELLALAGGSLQKTSGLGIASGATLRSSSSGDAWVLGGGQLARYSVPVSGDEAAWRMNILPVYARVCSACHDPGGTAGIPLATYAQWVAERMKVYDRVIVKGDMPQGRTLSDADKAAIAAWTMMKSM